MSERYKHTCPLSQKHLIAEYFMEYRAQLLDVAAFLDRLDRSVEQNAAEDFRYKAFCEALQILTSDQPNRVEKMQMILSDQDTRLLEERDTVSAHGAVDADAARVRSED